MTSPETAPEWVLRWRQCPRLGRSISGCPLVCFKPPAVHPTIPVEDLFTPPMAVSALRGRGAQLELIIDIVPYRENQREENIDVHETQYDDLVPGGVANETTKAMKANGVRVVTFVVGKRLSLPGNIQGLKRKRDGEEQKNDNDNNNRENDDKNWKMIPTKDDVRAFNSLCRAAMGNRFKTDDDDAGSKDDDDEPQVCVGVTCRGGGFNLSGFLTCAFLVAEQDWAVSTAISSFTTSRPPGIIHPDLIDALYKMYGDEDEKKKMRLYPTWPTWAVQPPPLVAPGLVGTESVSNLEGYNYEDGGDGCYALRDPVDVSETLFPGNRVDTGKFLLGRIEAISGEPPSPVTGIARSMVMSQIAKWAPALADTPAAGGEKPPSGALAVTCPFGTHCSPLTKENFSTALSLPGLVATWRPLGTDVLIYVDGAGLVFVIDDQMRVYSLGTAIHLPSRIDPRRPLKDTLLRGVFISDYHKNHPIPRVLLTDVIAVDGRIVYVESESGNPNETVKPGKGEADLNARLGIIEREVIIPRKQSGKDYSSEPFALRVISHLPSPGRVAAKVFPHLTHEHVGVVLRNGVRSFVWTPRRLRTFVAKAVAEYPPSDPQSIDADTKDSRSGREKGKSTRGDLFVLSRNLDLKVGSFQGAAWSKIFREHGGTAAVPRPIFIDVCWTGKDWRPLRVRTDRSRSDDDVTFNMHREAMNSPVPWDELGL